MESVEQSILAEARNEVAYADQKASMVLAALGVGFGAALGGLFASDWSPDELPALGECAWWFGVLLAAASVFFASWAVWPRTHIDQHETAIYYWGHVARYKTLAELDEALASTTLNQDDRTRHQMWELCRIVRRKYELVRRAFISAGLAVLSFGIVGLAVI